MIPEYLDKNCLVYQKDAITFLNVLAAESVQLVLTDPPFEDDRHPLIKGVPKMESVELCAAVALAATPVLSPSGVLALRLSSQNVEDVCAAISKRTHLQSGGFISNANDPKSIVALFHKGSPRFNENDTSPSVEPHLALITYLIVTHTDPGDIVVDPFCSSGYVLEAAVKAGRTAYVSDQDPNAVADTIDRYKEHCAR